MSKASIILSLRRKIFAIELTPYYERSLRDCSSSEVDRKRPLSHNWALLNYGARSVALESLEINGKFGFAGYRALSSNPVCPRKALTKHHYLGIVSHVPTVFGINQFFVSLLFFKARKLPVKL